MSKFETAAPATLPDFRTDAFIGGRFVAAASGRRFTAVNPATGRPLAEVAACDAADIDRAVAAARAAFDDRRWAGLKPSERKRILVRFADLVRAHRDTLALTETLNMGKPISDAKAIDVRATADCIAYYGEAADKVYGEVAPTGDDTLALVLREPLGVVGCVTPWNFPMIMAAWKFAPALAMGNSVVLKPAEESPLTALHLAALAQEAGIPDGVFNVVPGLGAEAGAALGRHMDVDAIAFTGSTEVGRYFMRYSADTNLKRVSLELGGKTGFVVAADAPDLDAVAEAAAAGIFFNQGEMCTAGSRLLVDNRIKDAVVARVVAAAARWMPGDPLDPATPAGAVVSREHQGRILEAVARGQAEGARLVTGGGAVHAESGGAFVAPTVFDDVDPRSSLAQHEIFGPVLSVIGFDGLDQAVEIANGTVYGLGAAIWSGDLAAAHKAARRFKAGVVYVNCFDADDITVPFGGVKQSGFGRDKSLHALEKYSDLKTVWTRL
ncbi:aldehyde dehydrogenase [Aquabacter spiritensis]|uniref:Gamma-glutamyl-gamma-aminobutyraldehyde dehydrogenase n=1 Tax=Aquabacter spiritensis TaxID=933073 RepID=A0A4R3LW02_9HYPH|nr:aldehyde dehydrogenase [Aquabacter spiritensis]TCT04754.1 gamma-glutamyl-gamma-aminobutyraldehyde dehydrogenase [Aquabacter spiritensis]